MKRRGSAAHVVEGSMVLGYHFIFSAYGFWHPNDPRGSWSEVVREFELRRFGSATKVTTTRSIASKPHDVALRTAARCEQTHADKRIQFRNRRRRLAAGREDRR